MDEKEKSKVISVDWTRLAKEPIEVEIKGSTTYGFGSELGCLRIYHQLARFNNEIIKDENLRTAYSSNLKTWYIALDS